jgi:Na+-driven multidrug efflux pump
MAISAEEPGTEEDMCLDEAGFALIGILFMSVNILIDTIFSDSGLFSCYQAVTVVLLITFLISSFMAIGVGGGSVLSRALGAKHEKSQNHFCQSNYDDLYFMSLFVVLASFQF